MSTGKTPPRGPSRQSRITVERAVSALLTTLGHAPVGALRGTPRRVAKLWTEHLLAGEYSDIDSILARSPQSRSRAAVLVTHLDVHLICPHHLTVAFGTAHLAYQPGGQIAGFGALSRLATACTARLVLQEEATDRMAEALVKTLGARAAVAIIEATHPCHNVIEPGAHRAHATSVAERGDPALAASLHARLELALARDNKGRRARS